MDERERSQRAGTMVEKRLVSLGYLAERWDVSRVTARRFLTAAKIRPYLFGAARNATIRYDLEEVEVFMKSAKA